MLSSFHACTSSCKKVVATKRPLIVRRDEIAILEIKQDTLPSRENGSITKLSAFSLRWFSSIRNMLMLPLYVKL